MTSAVENRPRLLAMDFVNSIEEPIRGVDERGHPYLSYSGAHVIAAFVAGMEKQSALSTPSEVSEPDQIGGVFARSPGMFEVSNPVADNIGGEGQYSYEVLKLAYDTSHEAAVCMGYPSVIEALEHLDELRATPSTGDAVREALDRLQVALADGDNIESLGVMVKSEDLRAVLSALNHGGSQHV